MGIDEGSLTIDAKVLGNQWLGFSQAGGADGNSGDLLKCFSADAALIREDEVEQRRR
jgi:hypothetical protein